MSGCGEVYELFKGLRPVLPSLFYRSYVPAARVCCFIDTRRHAVRTMSGGAAPVPGSGTGLRASRRCNCNMPTPVQANYWQLGKNDLEPTVASMTPYTHCTTAAATCGQPCCLLCCCTTHDHLALPHLRHLPPPWLHLVHCVVPRDTRFCDDPAHTAHGEITRVSQDCERDHAKARV